MPKKRGSGEGSIYQDADGRWTASVSLGWKNGKRQRKVIHGKTRGAVSDRLKKLLRDQQQNLPIQTESPTVAQYLTAWLQGTKPTVRPKTYRSYEQMLRNHILPVLGKLQIEKLSIQDVQAFMRDRLERGHKMKNKDGSFSVEPSSPALVRYLRVVLRAALNQAMKEGLVARNVAALSKPPKAVKPDFRSYSLDEAKRLLAAAYGHRLEAFITVALSIGLRHGEALALKWSDFDHEAGELRVHHTLQRIEKKLVRVDTKSEKGRRVIPLPAVCTAALQRHRVFQEQQRLLAGTAWKETGYIFTTGVGTPMIDRNVLREFSKLLKAAKLQHCRIHDLRHSCVSLLAAQGVDVKTISDILGHSDVRLTQNVYQHVRIEAKRAALNRLDDVLNPVATPLATKLAKSASN